MKKMHVEAALPAQDVDPRRCAQIARDLYDQIASGKLQAGNRLPSERALEKIFSVSRPTIRSALIVLEIRGYLDTRRGSGTHVIATSHKTPSPYSERDVLEQLEACLAIEGETAALAAVNICDTALAELDRLARLLGREDQPKLRHNELAREFHLLIAHGANNGTLLAVVEDLWRSLGPSLRGHRRHASQSRSANNAETGHSDIVQALRSRDLQRSRAMMRDHVGAMLEQFLSASEEAAVEKVRETGRSARERFSIARTWADAPE